MAGFRFLLVGLPNLTKIAGFKISSDFKGKNWLDVDFWQVAIRKSWQVLLKKLAGLARERPPPLIFYIIAGLFAESFRGIKHFEELKKAA